jgi:lipoate---protein ligase
MALDEWLLEEHRQGRMPPVLRFYTWSRPTLSFGYHQRHWPAAWAEIQWQGQSLDWVRRPSGGRAVLHQGDLTYGLIASDLPPQRAWAYQHLCGFLIQGFRSLGLDLQYGSAGRGYIHNPNCFGTATAADLVLADGTKLIGSAQLWRKGQDRQAVLQHGSIRLRPDRALFDQVFGPESGPYPQINLEASRLIEALTAAAEDILGLAFEPQPLTPGEWLQVQQLQAQRQLEQPLATQMLVP